MKRERLETERDPEAGPARRAEDVTPDEEILRASLAVYLHLSLEAQLKEILRYGLAWAEAPNGFAFAWDEERRSLSLVGSTYPEDDPRREALLRLDPTKLASWSLGTGTRFEGAGPLGSLVDPWPGAPPRSVFALPLRTPTERPAGLVLLLDGSETHPDRLVKLGEVVRQALGNAVQVQAIRDLVIKDDTAECYNRRYFDEFLPEELARASRFRSPLSLIFFDMDNLKEVNTRFGHAAGSRSLREVSQRVRVKVRKFDKLFRFGGDEFCIVLPETEWHGALEVAERVREAIAGRPFLTKHADEEGIRMTASFGIASFPLHARTKEELIQQADRAMQRIKAGTKNSIAISETVRGDDGA
jgi:diguanylate cyclase (GGDEF)-like protein